MAVSAKEIWLDGEYLPWADANVHVLTHTLHYGMGVFEGIRCYEGQAGAAIFRLRDHIRRLFDSAKVCLMDVPYEETEIERVCREVVRRNDLTDCYLRPLLFHADGAMGLGAVTPVRASVAAFPWGAYLGNEGLEKGIKASISSYVRQHVGSALLRAKICGQYTTSILGKRLALAKGFQEALFCDADGYLAEGTGENLFLVRDGVLKTPPESAPILPGLTRDCVLTIGRDLGLDVRETRVTRDELFLADEAFLCGTAAEVTPIAEVDLRAIGSGTRGPITQRIQETYFRAVRGQESRYHHWLTEVGAKVRSVQDPG